MPAERTPHETRERIAAEVRAEMARQGKGQREIASALGMTQPVISLRLQGKRPFRAEELVAVADVLGVPVSQFLVAERAA